MKKALKAILLKIPYIRNVIKRRDLLWESYRRCGCFPGHYHSPIPLLEDVERDAEKIFENEEIRDIHLHTDEQFLLVQKLKTYYKKVPYEFNEQDSRHFRYTSRGAFYRYSDAIFLFCMMMHFKPGKIIEIGSGHSSAIMLDTNEIFFENKIRLSFIEPYPEERLYTVLRKDDKQRSAVIKRRLQDMEAVFFQSLDENDILFVDSSHVSKVGSDVNYIFFTLLPVLKPGVLIHFHDIFFPFELPKHWIFENKWFWNESYLLRAFLMNNNDYEIVLFNSLLQKKYRRWFEVEMPDCLIGSEDTGSIWIRKIR